MGRSQVEYNRKHGRGRGRGRGSGSGRGSSNNSQSRTTSDNHSSHEKPVPRHLQPTAASKGRSKIHESGNGSGSSPVPSYLQPTSSSAARTGRPKTTTSTPSSSPSTTPRRLSSPHLSSPKNEVSKSTIAKSTPPTTPLLSEPEQPRPTSTTKEPLPLDDHLPDSPEQRTNNYSPTKSPSKEPSDSSALLLYQTHSHITVPKPHDTPILTSQLHLDQLARALDCSLLWYQRLRLDPYVAISVDPHRCDTLPRRSAESAKSHDENDIDQQLDALLELDSINDATNNNNSVLTDKTPGSQRGPSHPPSIPASRTSGSDSTSTNSHTSTTFGIQQSKLMQRARRYKQQHPHSIRNRSLGTSQEPAPSSRKLPDPPTGADPPSSGSQGPTTTPVQPLSSSTTTPHHQHEWDLPTAVSDLTMPSILNRLAGDAMVKPLDPTTNNKPNTTTGFNVITRVLSKEPPLYEHENDDNGDQDVPNDDDEEEDEEDMDKWLDSALKSKSEESDAYDKNMDPTTPSSQPGPQNKTASSQNNDMDLGALAGNLDDEDDMEDWLDSQIS